MSSLARRTLRTTAAAAGIAVMGVGLAGHAFAAPELPALPGAEGLEAPAMPAMPGMPGAPSADGVGSEGVDMPGVATIEMPTINTAAPELPAGDAFALPTAPAAPESPADPGAESFGAPGTAEGSLDTGDSLDDQVASELDEGQNNVGAMQGLDMAAMAMDMAQSAAAGESFTEGRQIG